jgi:hypothetical protein
MGGKSTSSRALTEEEKQLFEQQTKSLQLADSIATEQFGLSQQDRDYFDRIYRGAANPNDPEVKAAIQKSLEEAKTLKKGEPVKVMSLEEFTKQAGQTTFSLGGYDRLSASSNSAAMKKKYDEYVAQTKVVGGLLSEAESEDIRNQVLESFRNQDASVDKLLFDSVKASDSKLSMALTDFADKTSSINAKYGEGITGIANNYIEGMNGLASDYGRKLDKVTSEYKTDATAATSKYGDYTKTAIDSFDTKTGRYQTAFEQVSQQASSRLGTADSDILSQQRGQQLAGISQSYQEAQKQLLGTLSRRGLSDSGIEAQGLVNMSEQEAMAKAGALNQSYMQAIGLSDQRRLQQVGLQQGVTSQGVGIASELLGQQQQYSANQMQGDLGVVGTTAQLGSAAAQGQYSSGVAAQQAAYQASMQNAAINRDLAAQEAQSMYQGVTSGVQQNIANLQLASGVSQGVYGGASNMLAAGGATSNQSASIAGSTMTSIGANDVAYQKAQMEQNAALMTGVGQLAGSAMGAYATIATAKK